MKTEYRIIFSLLLFILWAYFGGWVLSLILDLGIHWYGLITFVLFSLVYCFGLLFIIVWIEPFYGEYRDENTKS